MAQHIDIFLTGGQSNAKPEWTAELLRRLLLCGLYRNPEMSTSYHSGHWLSAWWNAAAPEVNYLADWYDAGAGTATLEARIAAIEAAGDTWSIPALFWFQGEGDSNNAAAVAGYGAAFRAMHAQLCTDLGVASLPVYPVMIDHIGVTGDAATLLESLRATLADLDDLGGVAIDSRGYTRADEYHLTIAELVRLAGNQINLFLAEQEYPMPRAFTAYQNGNDNAGSTWWATDNITVADAGAAGVGKLTIAGDKTAQYLVGDTITVAGSTGNNGTYTLATVTAVAGPATEMTFAEAIPDGTDDGTMQLNACPTIADSVTLADKTVALASAAFGCASLTNTTGKLGVAALPKTVSVAGAATAVSEHLIDAGTTAGTLTLAVGTAVGGSTVASKHTVNAPSAAVVVTATTITGGAAAGAFGVNCLTGTITADCVGGAGANSYGVQVGVGVSTINGNVTATAASSGSASTSSATTLTVNGNVTAHVNNGTTGTAGHAGNGYITTTGNLTSYGSRGPAVAGTRTCWQPASAANWHKLYNAAGNTLVMTMAIVVAAADLADGVVNGTVTGTGATTNAANAATITAAALDTDGSNTDVALGASTATIQSAALHAAALAAQLATDKAAVVAAKADIRKDVSILGTTGGDRGTLDVAGDNAFRARMGL